MTNARPSFSYILWMSQRTASSLLCEALKSTGIAGRPGEHLWLGMPAERIVDQLLERHQVATPADVQQALWRQGSTDNGVFGLKHSYHAPSMRPLTELFRQLPGVSAGAPDIEIWENAFPRCKHVFMTRRNKLRQAVSWWRAIKSEEWHRQTGQRATGQDLTGAYDFNALRHLLHEVVLREAGIQDLLSAGGSRRVHSVIYEDFVQNYEDTVRGVIDFFGIEVGAGYPVAPPFYEKIADAIAEDWEGRFAEELGSRLGQPD